MQKTPILPPPPSDPSRNYFWLPKSAPLPDGFGRPRTFSAPPSGPATEPCPAPSSGEDGRMSPQEELEKVLDRIEADTKSGVCSLRFALAIAAFAGCRYEKR